MCGHVDVEKPASLEAQHDEYVEQPEANRRHDGEVDGDRFPKVVSQERPPALGGRFPTPREVLGDRRLREAEAELELAAMLAAVPMGGSPTGGDCPVNTVVIPGGEKGDQLVGSPGVKVSKGGEQLGRS